ncbi:MAG: hypothetical protein HC774_01860 [Sphingomonadales bacterium]|nr:hypothetical protein [Sphingomonadales bacterium]
MSVTLTNGVGGQILGARDAVRAGTITIENLGLIQGSLTTANADGIDIRGNNATGTIINRAGGVIEGNARGIVGAGGNSYTGGGTTFATAGGGTAYQSTVRHLFITNDAGGIIRSVVSNAIATPSGVTILNGGMIQSQGSAAISVIGGADPLSVSNPDTIYASNITILSTGSVLAAPTFSAITLQGFGNPDDIITLHAGATIGGAIDMGGGTGDVLNLTGSGIGSFSDDIRGTETINVQSAAWMLSDNLNGVAATNIAAGAVLQLNLTSLGMNDYAGGSIVNNGELSFVGDAVNVFGAGKTLTGTGNFTITGSGSVTFTSSNANNYTGQTNVFGGTLIAGADNALSTQSAILLAFGGSLDLAGFNQTLASLDGAGAVTLGAATLTLNTAAASSFAGGIAGALPVLYYLITDPSRFLAHVVAFHTGPHVDYWTNHAAGEEEAAMALGAKVKLAYEMWLGGTNLAIVLMIALWIWQNFPQPVRLRLAGQGRRHVQAGRASARQEVQRRGRRSSSGS